MTSKESFLMQHAFTTRLLNTLIYPTRTVCKCFHGLPRQGRILPVTNGTSGTVGTVFVVKLNDLNERWRRNNWNALSILCETPSNFFHGDQRACCNTTRYPSGSSNVLPCLSQYGLNALTGLYPRFSSR